MILILTPNVDKTSSGFRQLMDYLSNLSNIKTRLHEEVGSQQVLTEIYLIGNTAALSIEDMKSLPCVERVVRVSEEYRVLGRHADDTRTTSFEYNGVTFSQDNLNIFAGLC